MCSDFRVHQHLSERICLRWTIHRLQKGLLTNIYVPSKEDKAGHSAMHNGKSYLVLKRQLHEASKVKSRETLTLKAHISVRFIQIALLPEHQACYASSVEWAITITFSLNYNYNLQLLWLFC